MILQALYQYQKRQEALGRGQKLGCAEVELKFLVEISDQGKFRQLVDLREGKRGKIYTLPQAEIRSGKKAYEKPCLMWDSVDFVLGHPKSDGESDRETAANKLEFFTRRVKSVEPRVKEPETKKAVAAVVAFYDGNEREKVAQDPKWKDCASIPGCKMSFRLSGDSRPVAALPEILDLASEKHGAAEDVRLGRCLITGETGPLAVLHPQTPIRGGQATGKLVGFQKSSGYDSYFKEQGLNAPVSQQAAFEYATALNGMLASERNSFYLAGDSYVFWTMPPEGQKDVAPPDDEDSFASFLRATVVGVPKEDDPDKGAEKVRAYFENLRQGIDFAAEDGRFYLLGLSPNSARISVRLWRTGTIKEFKRNLQKHIEDFTVMNSKRERPSFTLYEILRSTTLDGKVDKLPPNLSGSLLDSVVGGSCYPMTLYQRVIGRARAERRMRDEWAAVVKGSLNRWAQRNRYELGKENFTMSLDVENRNEGYVLGRLFAVIEKIQQDALPGINATIGDRYYGAASSTPAAVIPRLLRMERFHLRKLGMGSQIHYNQMLAEILSLMNDHFPLRLDIIRQGAFALGYYHQRQALFTKKEGTEADVAEISLQNEEE
ncbi:type I-C CRISPR-associated protein Cas8c/Csd1 [Pyramidobacter sp. C12-8]|uniref:type I-C CRISPR-associated protein Cas8c/Csd1 n=1 Tax=Pyramidobacter sp. C12-8 TaxID=1943580 RepID=UPI00098FB500|nr:type I-C CRISPR-associated protein Cas8c/Csd1 [Pyramidobacter sp. C12-8]OON89285.1 type I-C CRISPR-associated protein Cas8c/Csd1 [Pyramidobacter sp. C12-8]